jgi:hypothetical protein
MMRVPRQRAVIRVVTFEASTMLRSCCGSILAALCLSFAVRSIAGDVVESEKASGLRIGAVAVDITPMHYPVIVNGMFEERTVNRDVDPLFGRAFVLDDGKTRIAIVVVDSCMLPRELLDAVKTAAAGQTRIAKDHILISATHTHSAPSAMGCLGSRPDPEYVGFLIPRLTRAIQMANDRLQPAQIGFASVRVPMFTFCRSYIRRPDRIQKDPFGEPTVRANMHPGFLSPDAIGPTGPVDDQLSLVAMQTLDGKPLGVLANFSMHYVDSPLLSADYFGRFANHLGKRLDGGDGSSGCIVSMSQGTSGDLASMNYSAPRALAQYDRYADQLATIADSTYRQAHFKHDVTLAMQEAKLQLRRRVPDAKRLQWAKGMAEKIGNRRPKGWPEIYALEQIFLADEPERELKLQAVRIGDIGIAAIPDEVYAISGLKLKLQSPLPHTFTIELANGAEGYIPPPEQHKLGGYTTWAARTAGLEVDAEPQIVERTLKLLEDVSGKPCRPIQDVGGSYANAVMKSKPFGYWRLRDISGDAAVNLISDRAPAHYLGDVAYYLPGPIGDGFSTGNKPSRAVHFAGARVRAEVPLSNGSFSAEFWFWNGLPDDVRPVTGYVFSHRWKLNDQWHADLLGIGGSKLAPGKLFFSADDTQMALKGHTPIERRSWNHVVLVRAREKVRVYLNGRTQPEIDGNAPDDPNSRNSEFYFGGRHDGENGLEGKLCEAAVYDRSISADEVAQHYRAAAVPASGN